MKKYEKQLWVNVEKQLKKRINPDDILMIFMKKMI